MELATERLTDSTAPLYLIPGNDDDCPAVPTRASQSDSRRCARTRRPAPLMADPRVSAGAGQPVGRARPVRATLVADRERRAFLLSHLRSRCPDSFPASRAEEEHPAACAFVRSGFAARSRFRVEARAELHPPASRPPHCPSRASASPKSGRPDLGRAE